MPSVDKKLLRWSLVAVWLLTAATSLWELNGQSADLLRNAGIPNGPLARLLICGGAALDAGLGLTMAFFPGRFAYFCALAAMLAMTVVATVLDPTLWLHPLGPLTKNLPIAAALWLLARDKK